MNRIERYLKRLMQLSWLVTLISTLAAFFYSYDDISPLVTFAAFSWAASVCLSILYVVIAVSSAYFSNQRLPYRTMSVFIAAFVLIGILIYLGTIGVSF